MISRTTASLVVIFWSLAWQTAWAQKAPQSGKQSEETKKDEEPFVNQQYSPELEMEQIIIEPSLADDSPPSLSMVQAVVIRYGDGDPIPAKERILQMIFDLSDAAKSASSSCHGVELRVDSVVIRPSKTVWATVDGHMVIANFPLKALGALAKAKTISGKICRDQFKLASDVPPLFAALQKEATGEPVIEETEGPVAEQVSNPEQGMELVRVDLPVAEDPNANNSVGLTARVVRADRGKVIPFAKRKLELLAFPGGDGCSASAKCHGATLTTAKGAIRPAATGWDTLDGDHVVISFPLTALHALGHSPWVKGSVCRDRFVLGNGFRKLLRALEKDAAAEPIMDDLKEPTAEPVKGPALSLKLGTPVVKDSQNIEPIQRILRMSEPALKNCLERLVRSGTRPTGSLEFALRIGAIGKVNAVTAEKAPNAELAACISARLQMIRFPADEGGQDYEVGVPIEIR